MTWIEWDAFPDPPKRRRKPHVEQIQILPPLLRKPRRYHRVEINVRQHQRSRFLPILFIAVVALILWHFKFGVLLAMILGWQAVKMVLSAPVI
jgi:hypothetical protein